MVINPYYGVVVVAHLLILSRLAKSVAGADGPEHGLIAAIAPYVVLRTGVVVRADGAADAVVRTCTQPRGGPSACQSEYSLSTGIRIPRRSATCTLCRLPIGMVHEKPATKCGGS